MGDPEVDPVIERIFATQDIDAINRMIKNVENNQHLMAMELPPEIERFFDKTSVWPSWADMDQIRTGERLFSRYGIQMVLGLFCWSLPSCYACAKGAQVLGITRRIGKDVHRRIIETAQFILDVMAEGGLEPQGNGVRTAQKIRLLHTTIRYHISRDPRWRSEWGIPINQEDMAGTLMSFALIPRALTKLGLDFTSEEEGAYFHCWRLVGHILGVENSMLLTNVNDGQALWDAVLSRQVAPSESGRDLTEALVSYMQQRVPGTLLDGIPAMFMNELCTRAVANAIGLEPTDWTARFAEHLRIFFGLTDEVQDRSGTVAKISAIFSRRLIDGPHYVERGGKK